MTMANLTKMTTKGQVTIPKRLRDYLKPGSDVDFELAEDGRVFLKSHGEASESRFARLRGSAKLGMTTDELMALTRGEETDRFWSIRMSSSISSATTRFGLNGRSGI
jgi:AbrB family looped-hinge helix DNA binding protein